MVLEKNIGGFNIPMEHFILMQECNSLSKLLENCEILIEIKLVKAVVLGIGNFSEKVSSFKSSHYRAFSYRINLSFSDVQIVLSDIWRFQVTVNHQKIVLILVA